MVAKELFVFQIVVDNGGHAKLLTLLFIWLKLATYLQFWGKFGYKNVKYNYFNLFSP